MLKKHAENIDRFEEPADDSEIAAVEQALGTSLPSSYKSFLRCTSALSLDGFSIGLDELYEHPAVIVRRSQSFKTICIAEYWLEGDGDQVVIEYSTEPADDAPVYYYAHSAGTNTVRKLAKSFTTWIESLPKSDVFQD